MKNRNNNGKRAVRRHSITFTQPTMTQQQFKEECDINNVMRRYIKTGVIDHLAKHQAQYADIEPVSYHEAMNTIATANSMFEELPAQARRNFNNDPTKFLEFVQNPDNSDKLIDMGLATAIPGQLVEPGETQTSKGVHAPASNEPKIEEE